MINGQIWTSIQRKKLSPLVRTHFEDFYMELRIIYEIYIGNRER